jgi:DNA-binding transcriptional regulator GbsR (MarR family)
VGYEASNIFKIWIPERQEVVSARDVTFDEDSFLDPTVRMRRRTKEVEIEEELMMPVAREISDEQSDEESNEGSDEEVTELLQAAKTAAPAGTSVPAGPHPHI